MQNLDFYRGLLCGIRLKKQYFIAEGFEFQHAFLSMIQSGQQSWPEQLGPVLNLTFDEHGFCRESEIMLIIGQDLEWINVHSPVFRYVSFNISLKEASHILRTQQEDWVAPWFLGLGIRFAYELDKNKQPQI